MPMCVQNFTDSLVDENFPIIEEEIQYQIRMKTDIPFVEAEKPDVSIFCWLCWKFRSV